ncbi:hypothetical protein O997_02755 [Anaplasma phagocytophilum str. MRK]|nr:hypothetical protein O997_02755 [Anaplasma phagocytophilum str. MRK]
MKCHFIVSDSAGEVAQANGLSIMSKTRSLFSGQKVRLLEDSWTSMFRLLQGTKILNNVYITYKYIERGSVIKFVYLSAF